MVQHINEWPREPDNSKLRHREQGNLQRSDAMNLLFRHGAALTHVACLVA
jgi:hypothetical protein